MSAIRFIETGDFVSLSEAWHAWLEYEPIWHCEETFKAAWFEHIETKTKTK